MSDADKQPITGHPGRKWAWLLSKVVSDIIKLQRVKGSHHVTSVKAEISLTELQTLEVTAIFILKCVVNTDRTPVS